MLALLARLPQAALPAAASHVVAAATDRVPGGRPLFILDGIHRVIARYEAEWEA
jgi:hypothetical protein